MPDELYLSLWVRNFSGQNMLRHYAQLLNTFPFSRLRPGISDLRIYALEFVEPPVLERNYSEMPAIEDVVATCREFEHPDSAYVVEGWWELWQYDRGWKLTPTPVSLACYGPEFDNEIKDQLRINFGSDAHFLPQPQFPDSVRSVRSNVKSLVRLTREVKAAMPIAEQRLWSESGENFAERLEDALAEDVD